VAPGSPNRESMMTNDASLAYLVLLLAVLDGIALMRML
jgi:hypothetical protein